MTECELFDADYLHFYGAISDATNERDTELISALAAIEPGQQLLDLGCGYGRISERLARRGAVVTGWDSCTAYLEVARQRAGDLPLEYVEADMCELDEHQRYDRVLSWFTSFGLHDDTTCHDLLGRMQRALRPGGRLLLESLNIFHAAFDDGSTDVEEIDGDLMIDRKNYDPTSGRVRVRRSFVRSGKVRSIEFSQRLFAFTELRDWLRQAGFGEVTGFGAEGERFSPQSERLIVVASK